MNKQRKLFKPRALFGYILEKLTYGGYRLRIQNLAVGEVETVAGFDAIDLIHYAHTNYPNIIDMVDDTI